VKYVKEFKKHFSEFPVFSASDVALFLKSMGASDAYARLFVHNARYNGTINKVSKGHYSLHDDVMVAGFAFYPFYYGLGEALSIHKIWDQAANPTIITTRKVRNGIRQIFGRNVIVRRISRVMFFGYEIMYYSGFNVPVSDLEKTLIDIVYFNFDVDGETLKTLLRKIDVVKFRRYLARAKRHMNAGMLADPIVTASYH